MEEVQSDPPVGQSVDQDTDRDIILALLKDIPSISSLSTKEILEKLQSQYSRDFDKKLVKQLALDYFLSQAAVAAAENVEVQQEAAEEPEEESEEEPEEESEEEPEEEPQIEFPDGWKEQFDDVIWVQTSKRWPWYPAIVANPHRVQLKDQPEALKNVGKKHTVMYYETGQVGFASQSQMKPFKQFRDQLLAEANTIKKYSNHAKPIEVGVQLADQDCEKEKPERWTSRFPIITGRKRKAKKSSWALQKKAKTEGQSKTAKKATAASMSGFNIPTPAAPASMLVSVPSGGSQEKKKPIKAPVKAAVVDGAAKAPKATATAGPSESEGEAEFDFDEAKDDAEDGDYMEEPKQKKHKSSSSGEAKEKKIEKKQSSSKESKKAKASGSSSSKEKPLNKSKEKKSKPANAAAAIIPLSSSKPSSTKATGNSANLTKILADETNEMRAKRLLGLLGKCGNDEKQGGFSPALKDKILKFLDKLQQMRLNLDELKATNAVELVTQWRKHKDVDISAKAKTVRQVWKEHVQKSANVSNLPVAIASSAAPAPLASDSNAHDPAVASLSGAGAESEEKIPSTENAEAEVATSAGVSITTPALEEA